MNSFETGVAAARLRYHDIQGSGPALIFMHGLGCASSCDYPRIASEPALAGRRMLLVDLLGFGFSDRPAVFGYTVADHAMVIAAWARTLPFGRIALFGHSMGGAVAIAAATLLGERVSHVVLGEPNLGPGGGVFSRRIAAMSEDDYVARGHDELVAQSRADGNDIWAASLAISSPMAVHRGATSLVAGSAPSWRQELYALRPPRTVIIGERSLPYRDAQELPRNGVSVAIVPAAGHSMAWENPAGLAAALREALG